MPTDARDADVRALDAALHQVARFTGHQPPGVPGPVWRRVVMADAVAAYLDELGADELIRRALDYGVNLTELQADTVLRVLRSAAHNDLTAKAAPTELARVIDLRPAPDSNTPNT